MGNAGKATSDLETAASFQAKWVAALPAEFTACFGADSLDPPILDYGSRVQYGIVWYSIV